MYNLPPYGTLIERRWPFVLMCLYNFFRESKGWSIAIYSSVLLMFFVVQVSWWGKKILLRRRGRNSEGYDGNGMLPILLPSGAGVEESDNLCLSDSVDVNGLQGCRTGRLFGTVTGKESDNICDDTKQI